MRSLSCHPLTQLTLLFAHKIFENATLYFSEEGIPNLPLVIPAMDHIDTHLADIAIDDDYMPAVRAAALLGKKTLNKYYNKSDDAEIYRIAMGKYLACSLHVPLIYFL